MKTVYILKGLPASGKSTWAKKQIDENPGKFKRINKDDLRAMLDNSYWSKGNEKLIIKVRDILIIEALKDGKHLIVDDTNLNSVHEKHIEQLIKKEGLKDVKIEINDTFLQVSVEECIERDLKRTNSVGERVIRRMYNDYIKTKEEKIAVESVVYAPNLPDCYICDIDGTLALMGNRTPFEWHKVGGDKVNVPVKNLLERLQLSHSFLTYILISGREDVCEELTEKWLRENNISYDKLYMRKAGDKRKDSIVKREIYEEYVKDKYNVLGIFDDRNQVVEMWRSIGLPCFQVADGDF